VKSSSFARFTVAVVLSMLGTASWWEAACANATPETTASAESQIQGMGAQAPAASVTSPVTINGRPLSAVQVRQLQAAYGVIIPGRYWYDPISGYWGLEGRDPAGYTQTGLNFGPVSPRASNGHSGAFLNGREISFGEPLIYSRISARRPPPGASGWMAGRAVSASKASPMRSTTSSPAFNRRAAAPAASHGATWLASRTGTFLRVSAKRR
jgi:hypothetical protein